jgi:hypothetical protein
VKVTGKKQNKRLPQDLFLVRHFAISMMLTNFFFLLRSSRFSAEQLVSADLTRKSFRNC